MVFAFYYYFFVIKIGTAVNFLLFLDSKLCPFSDFRKLASGGLAKCSEAQFTLIYYLILMHKLFPHLSSVPPSCFEDLIGLIL